MVDNPLTHGAGFIGRNQYQAVTGQSPEIEVMHGIKHIFYGIYLGMTKGLIEIAKCIITPPVERPDPVKPSENQDETD